MFKTPERKEFPSRHGGTLADNRPTLFDAKKVKWSAGKTSPPETDPFCDFRSMIHSCHSVVLLRPNRPRRGGRAAECGGLLILPALFVLTDFDSFG